MTTKKAHVTSPIHLGDKRIEPGAIVDLSDREFAHLFRHGAVEPVEAFQARKNAETISARARAEAERLYAEVMAKSNADAEDTIDAQSAERESFDPKRAAEERKDASKRARAATA